jgi:hypothetical protein
MRVFGTGRPMGAMVTKTRAKPDGLDFPTGPYEPPKLASRISGWWALEGSNL